MNTPIHTYIESIFHPQPIEIVYDTSQTIYFYMVLIKTKHGTTPFVLIEEPQLNNHTTLIKHIKTQLNRQIKTLQEYPNATKAITEIQEIQTKIK